ncbi:MAG: helix-turn-helix transcriptional regulator [Clostridia bacterium]|nr:helix-turn-helix transcriptional regulator [Clostridia bacterium]
MNANILSNMVITKVHSVSTMYTPQHRKAKRTDRQRWALVIKYEGETVYTSNGKSWLSDANHIAILPKGCSYDWQCTRAGHFSIIEFESALTCCEPFTVFVKNSERILKLFRELEYTRNLQAPMMEIESIWHMYSIILALAQGESEPYAPLEKQKKIAPALEYISQHYDHNMTNDQLATLTGLSTVYFRKLFTQIMGVSPISYVHDLRIQKAKEMLRSDYDSLSSVAQSLGYLNLYDFSRDFKKHTGVAPSKYE